jgi:hypothetical protein
MVCFKRLTIGVGLTAALVAGASPVFAQTPKRSAADDTREVNLSAYVELLRSDLRTQKVGIIVEVMQLTDEEDVKFWPLYREYETQLAKINDERLALIRDYAVAYETITDEVADRLARGAIGLEARRHALKAETYDRLRSAISPKTAARFLQVENQILLLLDLQIAASLPIVQ